VVRRSAFYAKSRWFRSSQITSVWAAILIECTRVLGGFDSCSFPDSTFHARTVASWFVGQVISCPLSNQ